MSIGKQIKFLRESAGLNQVNLGKIIGVSDKAVSAWETDKKVPRMGKLQAIADYFGVPKSYIIDGDRDESVRGGGASFISGLSRVYDRHSVPRIVDAPRNHSIMAPDNVDEYDDAPSWLRCDFSFVCKDDSMIGAGIHAGSVVFIKQQSKVTQGQIAAVVINGKVSLKRVQYIDGGVALWPENPQYEPMIFVGRDKNKVRIIGLAAYCINEIK